MLPQSLIRFDWAIKRLLRNGFKAKGLKQARELLKIDKLSESERVLYKKHLDDLHYMASMVKTWQIEEEDRIKKDNALDIAKNSLKIGLDIHVISQITGLTIEEINQIK
jgi:hypothetical protein